MSDFELDLDSQEVADAQSIKTGPTFKKLKPNTWFEGRLRKADIRAWSKNTPSLRLRTSVEAVDDNGTPKGIRASHTMGLPFKNPSHKHDIPNTLTSNYYGLKAFGVLDEDVELPRWSREMKSVVYQGEPISKEEENEIKAEVEVQVLAKLKELVKQFEQVEDADEIYRVSDVLDDVPVYFLTDDSDYRNVKRIQLHAPEDAEVEYDSFTE